MSTNFYARVNLSRKRTPELHVGKRSVGWRFAWQALPNWNLMSMKDWLEFFDQEYVELIDEYGRKYKVSEFLEENTFEVDEYHKEQESCGFRDDQGQPFFHSDFC